MLNDIYACVGLYTSDSLLIVTDPEQLIMNLQAEHAGILKISCINVYRIDNNRND